MDMHTAELQGLNDYSKTIDIETDAMETFSNNYVIRPSSGRSVPEEVRAVAKAYTNLQWCAWGHCILAPSNKWMILRDPDFAEIIRKISPASFLKGTSTPSGAAPTPPPGPIQAITGGAPPGSFSKPGSAAPGTPPPVKIEPDSAFPSQPDSVSSGDGYRSPRKPGFEERIFGRTLTQNEEYALAAGGGLLTLGLLILIARR